MLCLRTVIIPILGKSWGYKGCRYMFVVMGEECYEKCYEECYNVMRSVTKIVTKIVTRSARGVLPKMLRGMFWCKQIH
jgi:hypothetical protein